MKTAKKKTNSGNLVVPAAPVVMLTEEITRYLNDSRNGGGDPIPSVIRNLTDAGLAGVQLVKVLDKAPGDPFAYPTDQATEILARAIGGHPVFRSGPRPGLYLGPDFNRIHMDWGQGYEFPAGAALAFVTQNGLASYKQCLEALRPFYA